MGMKTTKLHNSPAFVAASRGAGSVAGAGDMPNCGPGKAAARKVGAMEMPMGKAAAGTAPKGMKTYAGR